MHQIKNGQIELKPFLLLGAEEKPCSLLAGRVHIQLLDALCTVFIVVPYTKNHDSFCVD